MVFCHKCGKELPVDSEFCSKCGVKILESIQNTHPLEKTKECVKCKNELSFFRYNPKKEWNMEGQLCKNCWDTIHNEKTGKDPTKETDRFKGYMIIGAIILVIGVAFVNVGSIFLGISMFIVGFVSKNTKSNSVKELMKYISWIIVAIAIINLVKTLLESHKFLILSFVYNGQMIFCHKCGKELPNDAQYCNKCGVTLLTSNSKTEEKPSQIRKERCSQSMNSKRSPEDIFADLQEGIVSAGHKIKTINPNQTIISEGGRDYNPILLVVLILFLWPGALIYYFTRERSSLSVFINKHNEMGSTVTINSNTGDADKIMTYIFENLKKHELNPETEKEENS